MWSFLVPYCERPDFLAPQDLESLREQVLACPYLAATDLNEGFQHSYGFTVLFQSSQRERVYALLPALRPYLERVLDPRCQLFFLNPLVIHEGHGVAPHADKTLLSFLPKAPYPQRVTVLYLSVPTEVQGGQLVFHRNALMRARVSPRTNLVVDFAGWLSHEVTAWKGEQPRVSLVCEQYRLSSARLAQVPEFHLETTRDFAEFLSEAQQGSVGGLATEEETAGDHGLLAEEQSVDAGGEVGTGHGPSHTSGQGP